MIKKNKLYEVLKQLEEKDVKKLRKYIASPYFNKSKKLSKLYQFLIQNIKNGVADFPDKQTVWELLFGAAEIYEDVRFRKLNSDLLKLVEGFLAQQIYDQNPIYQATYLIEAVRRKKVEKLYNTTMNTARRLSAQQPYKPASYYYHQYQIETNLYKLSELESKRSEKGNVEEIINNLDRFYLAEKLRYLCESQSRMLFFSHEYKLLFIDEIIEHLKKHNYEQFPAVAVYFQVYLTQIEPEIEAHYFKLRTLLDSSSDKFSKEEVNVIYLYALNYCISKINRNIQIFLMEYFNLYEKMLEDNIVIVDGFLSQWTFKNIVTIASRLQKYDWTENFIQKYKKYLPEDARENAVSFNLAQVYFYQKKYDKVITMLSNVEYDDINYNLNSKTILVAVYYETEEIESLYSLLESFRVFLSRHKNISTDRRDLYANLIKFVRKITQLAPNDKKGLQKIKEEVERTPNIASAKWLKEKIATWG